MFLQTGIIVLPFEIEQLALEVDNIANLLQIHGCFNNLNVLVNPPVLLNMNLH